MPQNQAGIRLLTRCFNFQELDYLQQRARFQKAVAAMDSLIDFEMVATLGQRLLADRDSVQLTHPMAWPRVQA